MEAYNTNFELAKEYQQLCDDLEDKEEKYLSKIMQLKVKLKKEMKEKQKFEEKIQVNLYNFRFWVIADSVCFFSLQVRRRNN